MFVNALKLWSWEGRICRRQYLLAFILVVFGAAMIISGISGGQIGDGLALTFQFLASLLLLPSQIKRLHDIGWSGWIILLGLIPGINLILGLGLLIFSGTKGPNKYGEDPHGSK